MVVITIDAPAIIYYESGLIMAVVTPLAVVGFVRVDNAVMAVIVGLKYLELYKNPAVSVKSPEMAIN